MRDSERKAAERTDKCKAVPRREETLLHHRRKAVRLSNRVGGKLPKKVVERATIRRDGILLMLQFALAKSSPFNFLVVPPSCVPCVSSSSFSSDLPSNFLPAAEQPERVSASRLQTARQHSPEGCRARPPPLGPWLCALPGAERAEGTREALTWCAEFSPGRALPSPPRCEVVLCRGRCAAQGEGGGEEGRREGGGREEGDSSEPARQGFPTASGSSQSKPLNHWEVKAIGGSLSAAHFKTAEFCGIFCVFVFLRWAPTPPPPPHP